MALYIPGLHFHEHGYKSNEVAPGQLYVQQLLLGQLLKDSCDSITEDNKISL